MPIDIEALEPLAVAYLTRQPWFVSTDSGPQRQRPFLAGVEAIDGMPVGLARLLLAAGDQRYQLLVGWRESTEVAGVLSGRESSLLGPVHDGDTEAIAYDALADPDLAIRLLAVVTGGAEHAERVRAVSTLVSHASLVFDERLFMKCYRVLHPGTRPEIELTYRLDEVGFNAMLAPVARWRADGFDLALVREFVADSIEGRVLALTSLRDLLAHDGRDAGVQAHARPHAPSGTAADGGTPSGVALSTWRRAEPSTAALEAAAVAGGDLAGEMFRLGATAATMHVALSSAFGDEPALAQGLLEPLRRRAESAVAPGPAEPEQAAGSGSVDLAGDVAGDVADALGALSRRLAAPAPGGLGSMIRLHGDFHLRRVMRSEAGWLVTGFGDDPIYGEPGPDGALPSRRGSPLEDLADLFLALRAVAAEAVAGRPADEAQAAADLAAAWVQRNREAVLAGYRSVARAEGLLPGDAELCELLLEANELVRTLRGEPAGGSG